MKPSQNAAVLKKGSVLKKDTRRGEVVSLLSVVYTADECRGDLQDFDVRPCVAWCCSPALTSLGEPCSHCTTGWGSSIPTRGCGPAQEEGRARGLAIGTLTHLGQNPQLWHLDLNGRHKWKWELGPGNVEKQCRLLQLSSKDTKKCVWHESLVSQITCSRLDSKSPKKKRLSLPYIKNTR